MPEPIYIMGTYKERRKVAPRTSRVLRVQNYHGADIVIMRDQNGKMHDCPLLEFAEKWENVKS